MTLVMTAWYCCLIMVVHLTRASFSFVVDSSTSPPPRAHRLISKTATLFLLPFLSRQRDSAVHDRHGDSMILIGFNYVGALGTNLAFSRCRPRTPPRPSPVLQAQPLFYHSRALHASFVLFRLSSPHPPPAPHPPPPFTSLASPALVLVFVC